MDLNNISIFKIEVFLPVDSLEAIRKALLESGAGVVGNYDNTYVTYQVEGHWRPLSGANPTIGTVGKIESAPEIKLETTCRKENVADALIAIRKAHPYEEPVIQVIPLFNSYFS